MLEIGDLLLLLLLGLRLESLETSRGFFIFSRGERSPSGCFFILASSSLGLGAAACFLSPNLFSTAYSLDFLAGALTF